MTTTYPSRSPVPGLRRVSLLLLPQFAHLTLAAIIEPLFVANWLSQQPRFQWQTVSLSGAPVPASNGISVPVNGDLAAARGSRTVFVLSSFEPSRPMRQRPLLRWLRQAARAGVELAGVENGSLPLAAAGLLQEHEAAVHWDNRAGFQELFPRVRLSAARYSFSRNRLTCAGGAAVLEMMIAWLERSDAAMAQEVAQHLLLRERNLTLASVAGSTAAQKSAISRGRSDGIARARALMQRTIDDPLPCRELAHRLNLSLRQLERRFQQRLGHSVHAEYRLLRMEQAHQYLQQTDLSVTEVAALTGFSSAGYFSKVYRRAFGLLPSADRSQSTEAPVFRANTTRPGRR
jgi:AraC family transcriptional regulator, carnitine catabolism transcriptional activator